MAANKQIADTVPALAEWLRRRFDSHSPSGFYIRTRLKRLRPDRRSEQGKRLVHDLGWGSLAKLGLESGSKC